MTSEEKHGRPNAKATEPGRGQARRILDLKNSEELLLDQKGGGNNQHIEERGHHSHEKHDTETAQISGIGDRPVRKKTPSIRYPAVEFDLSSNRASDRGGSKLRRSKQ